MLCNIMGGLNKYGDEHKAARKARMDQLGPNPRCEMTNQKKQLSAHHQVPKSFDGPDMEENYSMYSRAFHEYLHAVCNVSDTELLQKRIQLSEYIKRNILDDEKRERGMRELYYLDKILMSEYINNMIDVLAKDFHDIIFQTIYSNFQTIKKQAIQIHYLSTKLKAVEVEATEKKTHSIDEQVS